MELKSLKADSVTIEDAYKQIKNYMKSIESFFIYNASCVISDQSHTRAGTITANYDRFLEWKNKIKILMTGGNQDPDEWKTKYTGNKAYREGLAREFKNNDSEFKIAIVVDMWLTGFDVPSMSTMYVFKPMKGHNLMQAIARVNRVFKDKEGGLIVDYIGIASSLKSAMKLRRIIFYRQGG